MKRSPVNDEPLNSRACAEPICGSREREVDPAEVPFHLTRRHFFSRCAFGLGSLALAPFLRPADSAAARNAVSANPLASNPPHFAPLARNVIYLFMAGGPSQLELFDYKPRLQELNGQPIPESYIQGKRFAFMGSSHGTKLLGTRRFFRQHG